MRAAANVRVELLGAFRLTVEGSPIEIPRASARVIAWLVTRPGHRSPRSSAIRILWPDLEDRKARARLSQCLWTLKQCLPESIELVHASRDDIQLADSVSSDIADLRMATSMIGTSIDGRATDWTRFTQPLLVDWDDEWVTETNEALRRTLDDAMERHIELLAEDNDHQAAAHVATVRTHIRPYDESSWRSLLAQYDQLADPRAARSAFARMSEHLAELGELPSPDLVAAHEQRSLDPASKRGTPGLDRLVGRGNERAALIERLEITVEGFGSVVIVEGESGIGKSRLLDQFVADAHWRGLRLGRSVCPDVEVPFQPLCRAIEKSIAPIEVAVLVDTLDKLWLTRATKLLPNLPWPDDVHDHDGPGTVASADEDDRQGQALVEVLLNAARRHPVCLVIDDLHLADRWTLHVIHRLAELSGDLALLMILGYRTDAAVNAPPLELQRLDALPTSERITLRGLSQRGTYELARQIDERVTLATAKDLMAATGGSPFLIRHVMDRAGNDGLGLPAESMSSSVPDPIGAKLHARLPLELDALHVLAVAEEGLDVFSLTGACSNAAPESVATAVLTLVADSLLVERGGCYLIAHNRIRTAVLATMPSESLQRIAAHLLTMHQTGRTPAVEARLATRAGNWSRAVGAHKLAGDEAAQFGAVSAAAQHYSSAVEAARRCGLDDHEVADLLIALHDTYVLRGEIDGQRETLAQLRRLRLLDRWVAVDLREGWQALGDGDSGHAAAVAQRVLDAGTRPTSIRGSAFRLRAEALLAAGEAELALSELRTELEGVAGESTAHHAELLATLASLQREASEGDLGAGALATATGILASAGLLDQLTDAQRGLGMRLIHSTSVEEGFDRLHAALRSARRLGDRRREAYCVLSFGTANFGLLDNYGRGRSYLFEALDLAQSISYHDVSIIAFNNLGFAEAVVLGRLGAGIDLLDQGAEIGKTHSLPYWGAICLFSRAEVALRSGDEESAAELYELAEEAFLAIGSPQPLENVLADSAVLRARVGDFAAADRFMDRATSVLRSNAHEETRARMELSFAETRLLRGDEDLAAEHARRVPLSFCPGVLERYRLLWQSSKILRAAGRDEEADIHLGLAERFFARGVNDFEPQLREEVTGHQRDLITAAATLARRWTIVECERADGTPAGIRLDIPPPQLATVAASRREKRALASEISARAAAEDLRPSPAHVAELLDRWNDVVAT